MKNDTDIISLRQPEFVDDPLTEIARDGARRMLAAALQADIDTWLVHYNTERPHLGYRNQGRRPIETVMSC